MRKLFFIFCVTYLIVCSPQTVYSSTIKYKISSEHPRIMSHQLTPDYLKNICKKMPLECKRLLKQADNILKKDSLKLARVKWTSRNLRILALAYRITGKKIYAMKAIEAAKEIISLPLSRRGEEYNAGQFRLEGLNYVYDWCYDLISDKKKFKKAIKDYVAVLYKEQKNNNNFVAGHFLEYQAVILMAGIVLHGEEKKAEEWIVHVLERTAKFLPVFEYFMKDDGGYYMWWNYSMVYIDMLSHLFYLLEDITGEDWFSKNSWLENYIYFIFYGMRGNYSFFPVGDFFGHTALTPSESHTRGLITLAQRYNNGYAQWMLNQLKNIPEDIAIFYKRGPGPKPLAPENLPGSRLFKNIGIAVMKSGWDENGTAVLFKCTPVYFYTHSHRDQNSFIIYYKGDQAVDSGFYDRYGSEHWRNYYIRTIAHNTITVFDPEENFRIFSRPVSNDGGQKIIRKPHFMPFTKEEVFLPEYNYGKVLKYVDNNDFTYIIGDASKAYHKNKLNLFKRHFLFLKNNDKKIKPAIVIFDELNLAKKGLQKNWLLHTLNKPVIKDNIIYAENGKGALYVQTLLPENPAYKIIGGKGHEFEVNGRNYPLEKRKKQKYDPGSWRVEITPVEVKKDDYFLHYLQPLDINNRGFFKASLVETKNNNISGLQLRDKIILFSKLKDLEHFEYKITRHKKIIRHLVFGVQKNRGYTVKTDNGSGLEVQSSGEGVLQFEIDGDKAEKFSVNLKVHIR